MTTTYPYRDGALVLLLIRDTSNITFSPREIQITKTVCYASPLPASSPVVTDEFRWPKTLYPSPVVTDEFRWPKTLYIYIHIYIYCIKYATAVIAVAAVVPVWVGRYCREAGMRQDDTAEIYHTATLRLDSRRRKGCVSYTPPSFNNSTRWCRWRWYW